MQFRCDHGSLKIYVFALSNNPRGFPERGWGFCVLPWISDVARRHKAESAGSSSIIHRQKDKHMLLFPSFFPEFLKTPHLGLLCIFFLARGESSSAQRPSAKKKRVFCDGLLILTRSRLSTAWPNNYWRSNACLNQILLLSILSRVLLCAEIVK